MKCLVEHGADVNGRDNVGNTPLFEAVGFSPRIDRLEYLISQGADVHAKNNEGKTVLDRAREQEFTALDYTLAQQYPGYSEKTIEQRRKAIEILEKAMGETIV